MPFESHGNEIRSGGAQILNIGLPASLSLPSLFQVADPDQLIRATVRGEDVIRWIMPATVSAPMMTDWPDVLAARIRQRPVRLREWATEVGLAPETLSRGFRKFFGICPAQYRAECQAEAAFAHVTGTREPLSQIAYHCGFADQAHLSRAIKRLTGRTPAAWRAKSVQY